MNAATIAFVVILLLTACTQTNESNSAQVKKDNLTEVLAMKLTSDDFKQGDMIPKEFTCQGKNINPHLAWSDIPEGTKSFALILDDPDAPGGLFVHWAVKDIPSNIMEAKQNSVPGTQLPNDYRVTQYKGPCPPALHRYFFRMYALDVERLPAENYGELYEQVEEHAIAKAELMGKYEKS